MNTFLSDELQEQKKQYELFAKEQLAPIAEQLAERKASLTEFIKILGQASYLGITVPEQYGGKGGSFFSLVLFAEAVSFYEPGLALTLAGHTAVIELLKEFGSEEQKLRYLPLLAKGEYIGALGYLEDDGEEGLEGSKTVVRSLDDPKESNKKALSGKKCAVINGRLASLFLILGVDAGRMPALPGESGVLPGYDADAKSAPPGVDAGKMPALPGLALWLVDRSGQSSESQIEFSEEVAQLGLRSTYLDDVAFNNCQIGEGDRLESGQGLAAEAAWKKQIEFAQNISKTIMAAAAVGLTEGALARSANYARSEKRAGVPLANSQAVQWKIADSAAESSAARLLTYRAAWSKDEMSQDFSKYAAMCKSFAAQTARLHSAEALQILGGKDASRSDFARFLTDAKMIEMVEGSNEEQKVILATELGV